MTLRVRSYITQKDGAYRFHGLSQDTDYELKASYRGATSSKKMVSRFDSDPVVEINLRVETNQSAAGASEPSS
jgi:hypothetical protein